MAERRMFAKTIIDSDAFLDMPQSSQLLYFHLCMRADDEGFINNPKSIMRNVGAKEDDLKLLFAKKFVIPFESGVVVIKHWKIHNYIRGDRLHNTKYLEEKSQLNTDEKGAYILCQTNDCQLVDNLDTEVRLGKVRLGKDNKEIYKENIIKHKDISLKHKYGKYKNVLLTNEQLEKLKEEFPSDWGEWINRVDEYVASTGKHYKDYLATIRVWSKRDQVKPKQKMPTESIPEYNSSENIQISQDEIERMLRDRE